MELIAKASEKLPVKRRSRPSSAVLFMVLAVACDGAELDQPVGPKSSVAAKPIDLTLVEPLVFGQPDEHFLKLASIDEDFGGAYWQGDTLRILSRTGTFPPGLKPGTTKPVATVTATHSFEDLARWHRVVNATLVESAQWIDIDERVNRITAAVADKEGARQALRAAGVPDDVFLLRDTEVIQLAKDLTDEFRPVPGGVATFCTVGFNVDHWQWGKTFVIPSHCTDSMLVVDGRDFHQPDGEGIIGTEVYDDPGFTSSPCGGGKVCRYSDAALIEYTAGVDYELGS